MNAAIYCRVSTDKQETEGTSLDSQRGGCVKKAHELGYAVPFEYVFLGVCFSLPEQSVILLHFED